MSIGIPYIQFMYKNICTIQEDAELIISKTGTVSVLVGTEGSILFSNIIESYHSWIELSIGLKIEFLELFFVRVTTGFLLVKTGAAFSLEKK